MEGKQIQWTAALDQIDSRVAGQFRRQGMRRSNSPARERTLHVASHQEISRIKGGGDSRHGPPILEQHGVLECLDRLE
jgi:hypothetical protein